MTRPTVGDERTNWRRAAAGAFATATYWTMAAAIAAGLLGFPWTAAVLAWLVVALSAPAVVLGGW